MKFLLAVDASPFAQKAFDFFVNSIYLKSGKELEGDELVVMMVAEELAYSDIESDGMVFAGDWVTKANEEVKGVAEKTLKKYQEQAEEKGFSCKAMVVSGQPAEQIVNQSKIQNVDMVIVGSRGIGMFKRMLLGSVSDFVAKYAECPVLIVHYDE